MLLLFVTEETINVISSLGSVRFLTSSNMEHLSIRSPGVLHVLPSQQMFIKDSTSTITAIFDWSFFEPFIAFRNNTVAIGKDFVHHCPASARLYADESSITIGNGTADGVCAYIFNMTSALLYTDKLSVQHHGGVNGNYQLAGAALFGFDSITFSDKRIIDSNMSDAAVADRTASRLSPGGNLSIEHLRLLYTNKIAPALECPLEKGSIIRFVRDERLVITPSNYSSTNAIKALLYQETFFRIMDASGLWAIARGPVQILREGAELKVLDSVSGDLFTVTLDSKGQQLLYESGALMLGARATSLSDALNQQRIVDHVVVVREDLVQAGMLQARSRSTLNVILESHAITLRLFDGTNVSLPTLNQSIVIDQGSLLFVGKLAYSLTSCLRLSHILPICLVKELRY